MSEARQPAFREPVRIISDLHLGHRASRVEDAGQLAPLLDGAAAVVCNGDSWQEMVEARQGMAREMLDGWRALAAGRGVHLELLPGNHDPGTGGRRHVELADGAVFVSHGDVLFREGAPWSRMLPARRDEVGRLWREAGADADSLEGRLRLAGEVARILAPPRLSKARSVPARVWDAVNPPGRAWRMVRSWLAFPTAAAQFLEEFRPQARVFVCGHFHRAGIWRRRGRLVINTGAFVPPGPAWCVDVVGRRLTVRRIERRRDEFAPGRIVRQFEVL